MWPETTRTVMMMEPTAPSHIIPEAEPTLKKTLTVTHICPKQSECHMTLPSMNYWAHPVQVNRPRHVSATHRPQKLVHHWLAAHGHILIQTKASSLTLEVSCDEKQMCFLMLTHWNNYRVFGPLCHTNSNTHTSNDTSMSRTQAESSHSEWYIQSWA